MADGERLLNHELYKVKIDGLTMDSERRLNFENAVYDDAGYTLTDLKEIINLYESSKLENYIFWLDMHFTSDEEVFYMGYPDIKYNEEPASYKLTVGDMDFVGLEDVMNYILMNATESIDDFFGDAEPITFESTYGSKSSSITIEKDTLE